MVTYNRDYVFQVSKGKGKVGVECEMCSGGRVWKKYLQAFIEDCRKKEQLVSELHEKTFPTAIKYTLTFYAMN